jgi:gluconate 5-dehydrogenase
MSLIERLFGLDGRIALVTGSSGGIGAAMAEGLAGAGARVVINGRNADKVAGIVDHINADGGKAHGTVFDVADSGQVRAGVAKIEAEIGPIDILINNAGIQRRAPLEDYPEATWRELMSANLDSVFFVGQAVARAMIARKRGRIINICSVQSELGRPSIAPYTASKGAVKMLTKGMAIDWGKHGIRVNGLGPPWLAG